MIDEKPIEYYITTKGDPRGFIQPSTLDELWFHTGTSCNLSCNFCLEGSKPGDNRLELMQLKDVKPYLKAGLSLGVKQFSFTGGEPFVNKEMIDILSYALNHKPCLVLTNGTAPLEKRMKSVFDLKNKAHPLAFRVSFDWPDEKKHDRIRGDGNFRKSFETLRTLYKEGFVVSIARQSIKGENAEEVDDAYRQFLAEYEVDTKINIVSFPDFLLPGARPEVPEITENCMVQYLSEDQRDNFMCNFSKMIVKKGGKTRVYACTLVDDDERYDLGDDLLASMQSRILLGHHRCYSCFAYGASCSEKK